MSLKSIMLASAAALLMATSANAAPLAAAKGLNKPADGIELVKVKRKYVGPRHRVGPRPFKYRPGNRYRSPPANWRRYNSRPYDWRTRGCIIVGPIWFCP